jgi:DUF4097 and DUF4098 domain-containing protein YvlB
VRHDIPVTGPLSLTARNRAGDLHVTARDDLHTAVVDITPVRGGRDAEELAQATRVDLHGTELVVDVPRTRSGFFGSTPQVRIEITVPSSSSLEAEVGSGDLRTDGPLERVLIKTGSGDVTVGAAEHLEISSGSGDVVVEDAGTLRLTTGSGDARVRRVRTRGELRSGSGDLLVEDGVEVAASTGSGDVVLGRVVGPVRLGSGSGDLHIRSAADGEVSAKTASGDVVVGVPAGTAALLECSSVSGRVSSDLQGGDAPGEGEGAVALRLRTVSGDVRIVRA